MRITQPNTLQPALHRLKLFGRQPKLPLDLFYHAVELTQDSSQDIEDDQTPSTPAIVEDYVKLHQAHLRTVYEAVKKNRDIHMDKAKINYDRSATNPQYKIGQLVMIQESKVNKKKSKKLSYKWDGPFRITDIINKINFKLKRVETKSGNTIQKQYDNYTL